MDYLLFGPRIKVRTAHIDSLPATQKVSFPRVAMLCDSITAVQLGVPRGDQTNNVPERREIVLAFFASHAVGVLLQPSTLKVMSDLVRGSAGDIAPYNVFETSVFTAYATAILRDTARAREIAADERFGIGRHGGDDSIGCVYQKNGAFSDETRGFEQSALARVLVRHQIGMHIKIQVVVSAGHI